MGKAKVGSEPVGSCYWGAIAWWLQLAVDLQCHGKTGGYRLVPWPLWRGQLLTSNMGANHCEATALKQLMSSVVVDRVPLSTCQKHSCPPGMGGVCPAAPPAHTASSSKTTCNKRTKDSFVCSPVMGGYAQPRLQRTQHPPEPIIRLHQAAGAFDDVERLLRVAAGAGAHQVHHHQRGGAADAGAAVHQGCCKWVGE